MKAIDVSITMGESTLDLTMEFEDAVFNELSDGDLIDAIVSTVMMSDPPLMTIEFIEVESFDAPEIPGTATIHQLH